MPIYWHLEIKFADSLAGQTHECSRCTVCPLLIVLRGPRLLASLLTCKNSGGLQAFLLASPKGTELVGNRTECALLILLRGWGKDYALMREEYQNRILKLWGFSSAKKMASVLIEASTGIPRLYNKVILLTASVPARHL